MSGSSVVREEQNTAKLLRLIHSHGLKFLSRGNAQVHSLLYVNALYWTSIITTFPKWLMLKHMLIYHAYMLTQIVMTEHNIIA